ncbi:MAG: STAS domain-containing protein [Leptospira sp.]|jgi:anti-sigma B factor antagonist|nr:STAS domain-containing protein [Leptospira sp.]
MSRLEFNSFALELNTLEIQSQKVNVVSFQGQISNNNAFEISRKINGIFDSENYNIILNLTKLEYINSVGVAMLLTIIKTVDQHNGKIVIGGLNHFLENVIKLMELPKKVLIFHSIDEAKSAWE